MMMSEAIETALINAEHAGQGALVRTLHPTVTQEMKNRGLIGESHGLTRKGTIERERLISAKMDELF